MPNQEIFDDRRKKLEARLSGLSPEDRNIELKVYDLMVKERTEFETAKPANYSQFLPSLYSMIEKQYGSIDDKFKGNIEETVKTFLPTPEDGPGYIIGLGFKPEYRPHLMNGNYNRDIVGKSIFDQSIEEEFSVLGRKDKALILNGDKVYGTEIFLDKVNVTDEGESYTTSKSLGFSSPVNARQLSAISKSGQVPMVFYTLSQTTGDIRRYEGRHITLSTVDSEDERSVRLYSKGGDFYHKLAA